MGDGFGHVNPKPLKLLAPERYLVQITIRLTPMFTIYIIEAQNKSIGVIYDELFPLLGQAITTNIKHVDPWLSFFSRDWSGLRCHGAPVNRCVNDSHGSTCLMLVVIA